MVECQVFCTVRRAREYEGYEYEQAEFTVVSRVKSKAKNCEFHKFNDTVHNSVECERHVYREICSSYSAEQHWRRVQYCILYKFSRSGAKFHLSN